MDVVIKNGDIVPCGNGDFIKAEGVDSVFQRGEILMNMKRGIFYLNPDMGVSLEAESVEDPEKLELLLNEAIAPIEGLTARILECNGKEIRVRLIYGNSYKECKLKPNEYV